MPHTEGVRVTSRAQLEEARRLGHELSVIRRHFDDPGIPPKFWLRCSCGYESAVRRSEKALLGTIVWHLGKVLAESDTRSAEMRRNGR